MLYRLATTAAFGLALAAAGCTTAPPPSAPLPAHTTTSLATSEATEQVIAALQGAGFIIERDVGGLRATSHNPRFTACERILVRDRLNDSNNRSMRTAADQTTAVVTVRVQEEGARTRVDWHSRHSGNYLDRYTNLRFDAPCGSTGALEELLAGAVPA